MSAAEWIRTNGAAPVQSAVRLHGGRLIESSNPTQHVLLSVGAEEVGAHPLVHNLRQAILFKHLLDNVSQENLLLVIHCRTRMNLQKSNSSTNVLILVSKHPVP